VRPAGEKRNDGRFVRMSSFDKEEGEKRKTRLCWGKGEKGRYLKPLHKDGANISEGRKTRQKNLKVREKKTRFHLEGGKKKG